MTSDAIHTETDALVIGAGPGGYAAAIRGSQCGLDVTLVERDAYGGACLNRACIPSKAYITATSRAHELSDAADMGIHADVSVDLTELREWKDGLVSRMTGSVEKLCKANGVTLVEGAAAFADDHQVAVRDRDGEVTARIQFESCVVATGSRPMGVPGFDFADGPILDSAQALSLDAPPDRLLVVGGGYIGLELSTVFAKLGSDVTVIEMLDDVLPTYGPDVTRVVRGRAEDLGITVETGEAATDWSRADDGGVRVTTDDADGEASEYAADAVLVAVGREPVTETLGLENVGLETDNRGFLPTDDACRTARDHVFAIGDVAGEPMLAHVATAEGIVAAETLAGESPTVDGQAIPAAVFTDPEIGTVGMTEDEAADAGHEPVVGEMPLRGSGRAMTLDDTDGFVRLVADADGRILGCQVVGPHASELLGEVTLAIQTGATLADLATTIHTHPTLSEAVMEAAENARGQAIHTLNR